MSKLHKSLVCIYFLFLTAITFKSGFSEANGEAPSKSQSFASKSENSETVTARKIVTQTNYQVEQAPNPDQKTEKSLQRLFTYLNEAREIHENASHYSARLERHVFADDVLQDPEMIFVKVRQSPFSVYMKWEKDGQEVLYVDGKNNNRLIAKPTSGLAALRDIWHLTPDSPHAMKGCRYPVTELGIHKLHDRIQKFYNDRPTRAGVTCEYQEELLGERPVVVFHTTFHSPEDCKEYCSSRIIFDALGKWIIGVENYGWTKNGHPGDLIEKYVYHDLDFKTPLAKNDFSTNNPEYKFAKN